MEASTIFPCNSILPHVSSRRRGLVLITKAKLGDEGDEAKNESQHPVVDNMVVLRMRIKKLKVLESSDGGDMASAPQSSSDWKEWEKKVFVRYHEGVCDSVEMLQSYLMNTRPSVALGVLALLAMSIPFSSSVVMVNALKVARGLLTGCHVCIDIDF